MSRVITCDNHNGYAMSFSTDAFSPFILANVDGIYLSENNVTVSDNTMTDGGTYQGSVKKKRNIVLTLMDKPDNVYNQANRDILYTLFAEASLGTLTYTENDISRKINYYVEKIYKKSLDSRIITVSLICADPFFYDEHSSIADMANWLSDFEFIHEFTAEGETLGHKSNERIVNIVNTSSLDNIGMKIIIDAVSAVENPKIVRIEDDTFVQIGSISYPFTMQGNDRIIITTSVNDKHIYLIRNGVKTEINEYMTEDSTFIQLKRGDNHIGYVATSGEEYLSISIEYQMKYSGA